MHVEVTQLSCPPPPRSVRTYCPLSTLISGKEVVSSCHPLKLDQLCTNSFYYIV